MTAKTATKINWVVTSDKGQIDLMLASIKRAGETLAKNTHIACCSTLAHLYAHSNTAVVQNLLDSVHDMSRKNAIRDWFHAFGPVTFDGTKIKFVARKADEDTNALQTKALLEPFWEFSPEPAYKPVDIAKMIDAVVKRLETDEKKNPAKPDHSTMIKTLKVLVNPI